MKIILQILLGLLTSIIADDTITDRSIEKIENEIFLLINEYRESVRLETFQLSVQINRQAKKHSISMSTKLIPIGHYGFDKRGRYFKSLLNSYRGAENVAFVIGTLNPALTAINGWINSPGHLKNLEGNYNYTGIGVATGPSGGYYITQIFWE